MLLCFRLPGNSSWHQWPACVCDKVCKATKPTSCTSVRSECQQNTTANGKQMYLLSSDFKDIELLGMAIWKKNDCDSIVVSSMSSTLLQERLDHFVSLIPFLTDAITFLVPVTSGLLLMWGCNLWLIGNILLCLPSHNLSPTSLLLSHTVSDTAFVTSLLPLAEHSQFSFLMEQWHSCNPSSAVDPHQVLECWIFASALECRDTVLEA